MSITDNTTQQPGTDDLRRFGLVTGAIVAGLFGLLFPWLFNHALPLWPWITGGVLWIWAILLPASLQPVYRGWMAVGQALGWVNTRIILAVLFYLLFLPAGIIMKLIGRDPMARKFDSSLKTYRITPPPRQKNHVERPY
jgi:hypothetical protein